MRNAVPPADLFPHDSERADRVASLERQVACVQREIKLREYVYPRRIIKEQMSQRLADSEIATMVEVRDTVRKVLEEEIADGQEQARRQRPQDRQG